MIFNINSTRGHTGSLLVIPIRLQLTKSGHCERATYHFHMLAMLRYVTVMQAFVIVSAFIIIIKCVLHYVVWRQRFSNVITRHDKLCVVKKKVWFYIALYPVRWTAQSALHSPPLADLFIPTPFSASLGSILAMQQLRNDYSLTFPPLSIARYSFIQLSRLRRREMKENAQTSKRYQRGFEPGLSRLRVRHSTNWATALHGNVTQKADVT